MLSMTADSEDKLRTFLLGRILGLERHEYVAVAWSFAYFFCVLSSYYILRPVREEMAVASGASTIAPVIIPASAKLKLPPSWMKIRS